MNTRDQYNERLPTEVNLLLLLMNTRDQYNERLPTEVNLLLLLMNTRNQYNESEPMVIIDATWLIISTKHSTNTTQYLH